MEQKNSDDCQADILRSDSTEKFNRAAEWLTMERAPKDGSTVLGIDAKGRVRKMWWFAPSSRTQHWFNCETQTPFNPVQWVHVPRTASTPGAPMTFSNDAESDPVSLKSDTSLKDSEA